MTSAIIEWTLLHPDGPRELPRRGPPTGCPAARWSKKRQRAHAATMKAVRCRLRPGGPEPHGEPHVLSNPTHLSPDRCCRSRIAVPPEGLACPKKARAILLLPPPYLPTPAPPSPPPMA